jgi:putative restriction endonuclease
VAVIDAYGRACAVTGEHSLPALDAAHIRSYDQEGPHEVRNGILLRADLHRLFDRGYLTIAPEQRLEVSRRLREDYSNGHSYYPLNGSPVRVPDTKSERPDIEYLRWHNEHGYLG